MKPKNIILFDTICNDCGTTGTVMVEPDKCIVCGNPHIKKEKRQVFSEGWNL